MMMKRSKGLTLIEVMVTVAIVAVLAGVAWPLYDKQSMRNRRVDAVSPMLELQTKLDRCFYSAEAAKGFGEGTFQGCNYLVPATTPDGHYALNFALITDGSLLANKQGVGYTLTATRVGGGLQANDNDCDVFSITNTGLRTALKADASTNNACWGSN